MPEFGFRMFDFSQLFILGAQDGFAVSDLILISNVNRRADPCGRPFPIRRVYEVPSFVTIILSAVDATKGSHNGRPYLNSRRNIPDSHRNKLFIGSSCVSGLNIIYR
jgi:hypothetical protein